MDFIFSYMKKHLGHIIWVMLIKTAATFTELLLPYVLEYMIDDIAPLKSPKLIILWGLVMLALALAVRFVSVCANRGAVKISKKCIYSIRQDLFLKTIHLSGDQSDEIGLPSLISRMTSDSYNLQSFIQTFQTLGIRAPILLLGGIIIAFTMDTGLALILCVLAPILLIVVYVISRKGIPLYEKVQTRLDSVVRIMRENITGIRVIKALSKEDFEKRRFKMANEEMAKDDIKASVIMSLPGPVMGLAMNIGLSLVVLIGSYRVNKGVTKPGVILAFLTYFQMILMGVMGLNRVFLLMSKANASANRISSVMQQSEGLKVESDSKDAPSDDYIIFDNVNFSYGQALSNDASHFAGGQREKTLQDISFAMKKGSSLGIIGPTGSGKTTIINLLMRFYDPENGHIYVDGKNIKGMSLDSLRRYFGVVFQNDTIFADTISNNVVFGRDVDQVSLEEAGKDAMAYDFITDYDDGFNHEAAIHGANFSGGQKQRLLIARALAANPEILILDDSSSALDYRTDSLLRKNIREHHAETTTIIVAQRISSIMSCNQIIMLDEGHILGIGTHEQLLASLPQYKDIYETQMGEV